MQYLDLNTVLKPKDKITMVFLGQGLPISARAEYVVRQINIPHKGALVVGVAQKGKRKVISLQGMINHYRDPGVLILRGHEMNVLVDSDSKTGWVGSADLHFWNHSNAEDGVEVLIDAIEPRLLFNSLSRDLSVRLYSQDRETSEDITHLIGRLPRHELVGVSNQPEEPKLWPDPLNATLRRKLMAAEKAFQEANTDGTARYGKPICKMFQPGTAATWLLYGMEDDKDTLWVVADLGLGCVEYGTLSLREARQKSRHVPCGPEIDRFFDPALCGYTVGNLTSLSRLPDNLHSAPEHAAS